MQVTGEETGHPGQMTPGGEEPPNPTKETPWDWTAIRGGEWFPFVPGREKTDRETKTAASLIMAMSPA